MPQTLPRASSQLAIRLDGPPQQAFHPGSTITGRIVRTTFLRSSHAVLTLQLTGRSKTRINVYLDEKRRNDVYRSLVNFFDSSETTQRLVNGPVHVRHGSAQAWRFSIKVPSVMYPSTREPVPPTFSSATMGGPSAAADGFIEYTLVAKLNYTRLLGPSELDYAVRVLNIRTPPSAQQLAGAANLYQYSIPCRLATYRLVDGKSAKLSFKKRVKELFRLSSVPCLAFSLQVQYPAAFQIGNPKAIPFRIKILPDHINTTASTGGEVLTVTLTGIKFEITAWTIVSGLVNEKPHKVLRKRRFAFDAQAALEAQSGPIVVPSGADATPLDLGQQLGIAMTDAPTVRDVFLSRRRLPLRPSFRTENIEHKHVLRWKFELSVAGRSTTLRAPRHGICVVVLDAGLPAAVPGATGGGLRPCGAANGRPEAPPPAEARGGETGMIQSCRGWFWVNVLRVGR
jgi:hypothetical protein